MSWTAPAPGLYYYAHYEDTSVADPTWVTSEYPATTTTAKLSGLPVGHKIKIYVTAINAAKLTGPPSNTVEVTPEEPVPAAPQDLTVTANKNDEVDLSWDAVPGAFYYVYWQDLTAGTGWTTGYCGTPSVRCPAITNSFQAKLLIGGHHYQFRVEAYDAGGTSGWSNIVNGYPVAP